MSDNTITAAEAAKAVEAFKAEAAQATEAAKKANEDLAAHKTTHDEWVAKREQTDADTAKALENMDKAIADLKSAHTAEAAKDAWGDASVTDEELKNFNIMRMEDGLPPVTKDVASDMNAAFDILAVAPKHRTEALGIFPDARKEHIQALVAKNLQGDSTTPVAGATLIVPAFARRIEQYAVNENPIMGLAYVQRTGINEVKRRLQRKSSFIWADGNLTATGRDVSSGAQAGTSGGFVDQSVTLNTAMSSHEVAQNLWQDSFFSVSEFLFRRVAMDFAQGISAALVGRDNSTDNEPHGLLSEMGATAGAAGARNISARPNAPDTGVTADLGKFATVNSGTAATSAAGVGLGTTLSWIGDMYGKIQQTYQRNAVWLMNRDTLARIYNSRDDDKRFLFEMPYKNGAVEMSLWGKRVVVMEDMQGSTLATTGEANIPVFFGDISQCYTIGTNRGMRMISSDVVRFPSQYYAFATRIGGAPFNQLAGVALRMATN